MAIGIGAGQMSRVDSVFLAVHKARQQGHDPAGSVLASDAFFPFADGVEQAAGAGVTAIIQPGGSVRDAEVVEAANRHGMAMVMTGKPAVQTLDPGLYDPTCRRSARPTSGPS